MHFTDAFTAWLRVTYVPAAIWASWSIILFSYFFWHLAERLWPAQRGQGFEGIIRNLGMTIVYLLIGPVANFFAASAATYLVQRSGGPYLGLDLAGWLTVLPLWLGYMLLVPFALLPLFIGDFFYYWFHRLQHISTWLWEVHKFHHTDTEVNVTTSLRHHWLEDSLRAFFVMLPTGVLFQIAPAHAGFLGVVIGQWGWFTHANVKLKLGSLTSIFGGPQYHRIHHSIERHHRNQNFANFFPCWDRLFGTYYQPKTDEWPETGVPGQDGRVHTVDIVFGPFVAWARMTWDLISAADSMPPTVP